MPPPPALPVVKTKSQSREFVAPLPPKNVLAAAVASSRSRLATGKGPYFDVTSCISQHVFSSCVLYKLHLSMRVLLGLYVGYLRGRSPLLSAYSCQNISGGACPLNPLLRPPGTSPPNDKSEIKSWLPVHSELLKSCN